MEGAHVIARYAMSRAVLRADEFVGTSQQPKAHSTNLDVPRGSAPTCRNVVVPPVSLDITPVHSSLLTTRRSGNWCQRISESRISESILPSTTKHKPTIVALPVKGTNRC